MKIVIFWVAVFGWTMALIVHLLSVSDIDVEAKVPYVWLLHLGLFVVWVPIVFMLRKDLVATSGSGMRKGAKTPRLFAVILKRTPNWVAAIAAAGFFYASVNIILFAFAESGTPAVQDGQFVLQSHGQFIRNITEAEYHHYQALTVRGFSGHWIAFYGIAAAYLYPCRRVDTRDNIPKLQI